MRRSQLKTLPCHEFHFGKEIDLGGSSVVFFAKRNNVQTVRAWVTRGGLLLASQAQRERQPYAVKELQLGGASGEEQLCELAREGERRLPRCRWPQLTASQSTPWMPRAPTM